MRQQGRGERFSYKKAVLEHYPNLKCKRSSRKIKGRYAYAVKDGDKRISDAFFSSENAWADAYKKLNIKNL